MHERHHHHGCHESQEQGGGPAWFYGYHHDSGQMKMMNYNDYVSNAHTTYSKFYGAPTATAPAPKHHEHHHGDCGCGGGCHENDCHCECCISCADAVEYARCGEVRQIPLTFDNDTRREREVKLVLGAFTTEDGTDLGWPAVLSETEFKLGPCGHKTVVLKVGVECGVKGAADQREVPGEVHKCKVAYATLRAEGCQIRPMVIAVAVLPNDCNAHKVGCECGCCGCH